jgi:hypothetical protein
VTLDHCQDFVKIQRAELNPPDISPSHSSSQSQQTRDWLWCTGRPLNRQIVGNLNITFEPKANGSNDYAVAPLTEEYTYQITNGYDSALRALGGGADSFSVTACVNAS